MKAIKKEKLRKHFKISKFKDLKVNKQEKAKREYETSEYSHVRKFDWWMTCQGRERNIGI